MVQGVDSKNLPLGRDQVSVQIPEVVDGRLMVVIFL